MKQEKQIAGLYYRLSQEDERRGESLSIENQRNILRKYAEEHNFEIHDEYIDDGVSGTTFDRPQVQRLLDDAKTGVINTIIVKDLSRFGRNYIEVGQYLDYVFPAFGIRFIAIQDNVDTSNRDNNMDMMMPIMNVFNEWHAANTSKKIRAVKKQNAKDGVYSGRKASYGYIKGDDKKHTPVIDEETAPIVRRIFEMYASGDSAYKIVRQFNEEGIPSPSLYAYNRYGYRPHGKITGLWQFSTVHDILENIMYIGHLPQLKMTTVSYKNHKRYRTDKNDWMIVYNNHEPIISQELWDKVQERRKSVSHGRITASGYIHPLSGFLYCGDCNSKMRLKSKRVNDKTTYYAFDCGYHVRYGQIKCFSHHIASSTVVQLVLDDIRDMARIVFVDEVSLREDYIRYKAEFVGDTVKSAKKELKAKQRRLDELSRLMQVAYEDRVKGKMPEDICLNFIQKYSDEQKTLMAEITAVEEKLAQIEITTHKFDDFVRDVKKYSNAEELTREMCYELIDRIIVGAPTKVTGKERMIQIVYKADISEVLKRRFNKQ